MLFDSHTEDPNYNPLPEERPGGFEWGAAGAAQAAEGEQRENQWIQKTVKTVWMQQLQKETSQWRFHCNLCVNENLPTLKIVSSREVCFYSCDTQVEAW